MADQTDLEKSEKRRVEEPKAGSSDTTGSRLRSEKHHLAFQRLPSFRQHTVGNLAIYLRRNRAETGWPTSPQQDRKVRAGAAS